MVAPHPRRPAAVPGVGGRRRGGARPGRGRLPDDRGGPGRRRLLRCRSTACRSSAGVPAGTRSTRSATTPTDDEVTSSVDLARAAGMNMLRIPGGTVYEEERFFGACDRAGILVWQDIDARHRSTLPTTRSSSTRGRRGHRRARPGRRATRRWRSSAGPRSWSSSRPCSACSGSGGGRRSSTTCCRHSWTTGTPGLPYVSVVAVRGRPPVPGRRRRGPLLRGRGLPLPLSRPAPVAAPVRHRGPVLLDPARAGDARRAVRGRPVQPISSRSGSGPSTVTPGPGSTSRPSGTTTRGHCSSVDMAVHVAQRPRARPRPGSCRRGRDLQRRRGRVAPPRSPCAGMVLAIALRDLRAGPGWGLVDRSGGRRPPGTRCARASTPVAVLVTDEGVNGLDVHLVNDTAAADRRDPGRRPPHRHPPGRTGLPRGRRAGPGRRRSGPTPSSTGSAT